MSLSTFDFNIATVSSSTASFASGKEYENKGGYINHDIFFSKFTKQSVPFEAEGTEPSRLYVYNKVDHIRARKTKEVTDFEPTAGAPADDFLS